MTPETYSDDRGFFLETFQKERYARLGVAGEFVQDNQSRSRGGSLRGLHFQRSPGQSKLVRVARGAVWDVVVDLRRNSSTFGRWEGFALDDVNHMQIYIPVGFAHGFCAISEEVDFVYKVGSYYSPETEQGIAWNDPDVGISWPVEHPRISERDQRNPLLRDITDTLPIG